MTEPKLHGLRVLVVEDSFLLAASMCRMLQEVGCTVVGPVATVNDALSLAKSTPCDAGILDINLGPETSEAVAATLRDRRVPFLFVSGYASPDLLPPRFRSAQKLRKPISKPTLEAALLRTVGGEPKED